jgi:hypothetical protein
MDAVDADRLVARGVTFSAVFAGALGVLLLFAPDEVGGRLVPLPGAAVLVQLLAAALLGFGVLNWIGRHHKLGGIYGRAIVAANQMHFTVGALVLVNHGVRAGGSPAYWALSAIYVAFAVFFSQLLYGWRLPFRSGRLP